LTDLQKLLVERGALAELTCEEAFLPSLVALLRRTPADERDCVAGGAARLLRELCETGTEVAPVGALSAAVAALPASVHSLPCDYGGCAYGIHAAMRPCCDLVCFVGAASLKPFDDDAVELVRDLFVAQPGSFAALMHSMTFLSVLAERDARLIVQLASELTQHASWFARTPLLDVHISAYDLVAASLFPHPEPGIQTLGNRALHTISNACAQFLNEEHLDHALTERRIAAVAAAALLEQFDGPSGLVDDI
jgi:hypothetical protein